MLVVFDGFSTNTLHVITIVNTKSSILILITVISGLWLFLGKTMTSHYDSVNCINLQC